MVIFSFRGTRLIISLAGRVAALSAYSPASFNGRACQEGNLERAPLLGQ